MNTQRAVTAAAASLLVVAAASGVASAGNRSPAQQPVHRTAVSTEPGDNGPDTDNIQQGDQTSPDTASSSERSVRKTRQSGQTKASRNTSGETSDEAAAETSGEAADENSSETENSDGPGGHADPSGNVDHQFEGAE